MPLHSGVKLRLNYGYGST